MSTKHYYPDKYGNTNESGSFQILQKTDKANPGDVYLILFNNYTFTFWKPPYQFKDRSIGSIDYFLANTADDQIPFVFSRHDVKYVCTISPLGWFEQIDYLKSIFGPDRPGTFEE